MENLELNDLSTIIIENSISSLPINEKISLSENFLLLLNNSLLSKKDLNIELNKEDLVIIKKLISNSPKVLDDLNLCIINIIKDENIDIMDIPLFIQIIKDIYILLHEKKIIDKNDFTTKISLIKYIVQFLLFKNNIKNVDLINLSNNLIDICVDMIKFNSQLKKKTFKFKLC